MVIEAEQIVSGDAYIMAEEAVIEGTIEGDLFVLSQEVRLTGEVGGSVHLACETSYVSGAVAGSLRIFGRTTELQSGTRVGRDVMMVGENLKAETGSTVEGEVYAAAVSVDLAGQFSDVVHLAISQGNLNGSFASDVIITMDDAPLGDSTGTDPSEARVKVGPTAIISGNLAMLSNREPEISSEATLVGELLLGKPAQPQRPQRDPVRTWVRGWFLIWGQLLAVGLGFRLLLPGRAKKYLQNLHRQPLMAVILGPAYWLLVLAGGTLALIATLTTLAGLSFVELWDVMPLVVGVGLVAVTTLWGGGGLLGFILGPVLTSIWFCQTVFGWLPGLRRPTYVLPMIVGTAALSAGIAVPQWGWILWLVTASFGSGAFLVRSQAEPPPASKVPPATRYAMQNKA